MSIQGPSSDDSQPAHWLALAARIRAGDIEAVSRLGAIFQGGIRFFLCRTLGQEKLEDRQNEVLSLIAKDLGETSIDNSTRLTSRVVTVLRKYIASQTTAYPQPVSEDELRRVGAVKELLAKLAPTDRQALYRYYVDTETEEQICSELNITPTHFHAHEKNHQGRGQVAAERVHTRAGPLVTSILAVDGDTSVRQFLRSVLEGAGYEVLEASNGKEATEEIRRNTLDLVITAFYMLSNPAGVAVDSSGNLYISEMAHIRKISKGVITTVVGGGASLGDNVPATSAALIGPPAGIAMDSIGNLYLADQINNRIRKVSNGVITTVAGSRTIGFSGDNGPAATAGLSRPSGVAVDSSGRVKPWPILRSATINAAQLLEWPVGVPAAGRFADIIAVDGDPAMDISALDHVTCHVCDEGRTSFPAILANRLGATSM
jgi:hypothetical protein